MEHFWINKSIFKSLIAFSYLQASNHVKNHTVHRANHVKLTNHLNLNRMNNKWDFLTGTYWYVPEQYLPATQMGGNDTEPIMSIDQTVWQITGASNGYFWGNCAALFYPEVETPGEPSGKRMIGSVTPDGKVQISFMLINESGIAMSVSGWGKMVKLNDAWTFEMQMASGTTDIYSHWAFMYSTSLEEPSWNKLPGVDYSVPEFLEAAGF